RRPRRGCPTACRRRQRAASLSCRARRGCAARRTGILPAQASDGLPARPPPLQFPPPNSPPEGSPMVRLFTVVALVACCGALASAEDKKPPMIGHMVYFKLKDGTPENRKKLVEACEKYLSNHPGTV